MIKKQQFIFSILTENKIGLVHRIVIVFTRRKINIESLTSSETEVKGIYRFTIVITLSVDQLDKLVGQLEKIINVIKVYAYCKDEAITQELALYKIKNINDTNLGIRFQKIIEDYNARLLTFDPQYLVIEKTGTGDQILGLLKQLEPFQILGFIRSGEVAMGKPIQKVSNFIKELERSSKEILKEANDMVFI